MADQPIPEPPVNPPETPEIVAAEKARDELLDLCATLTRDITTGTRDDIAHTIELLDSAIFRHIRGDIHYGIISDTLDVLDDGGCRFTQHLSPMERQLLLPIADAIHKQIEFLAEAGEIVANAWDERD